MKTYFILILLLSSTINYGGTWSYEQTLTTLPGAIQDLAFGRAPGSEQALLTSVLGSVQLWNLAGKELIATFPLEHLGGASVDWDPRSTKPYKFVVPNSDGSCTNNALIWPVEQLSKPFVPESPVAVLWHRPHYRMNTAMYSSALSLIVTCSNDGSAKVWSAHAHGVPAPSFEYAIEENVQSAQFIESGALALPAANVVVTVRGTANSELHVFNPQAKPLTPEIIYPVATGNAPHFSWTTTVFADPATSLFSAKGLSVDLVGINNSGLTAFFSKMASGKLEMIDALVGKNTIGAVATMIIHHNEGTLGEIFVGYTDGTVILKKSDGTTQEFTAHYQTVNWMGAMEAGQGQGGFLVTASQDGTAKLWAIDTIGQVDTTPLVTISAPEATGVRIAKFQVSPDFPSIPHRLAVGFDNNTVVIYRFA